MHFNDREIQGELKVDDESIKLSLREKNEPGREITISDDGRGKFSLGYYGAGFELNIQQYGSGKIDIKRKIDGKSDEFSASNYSELQEKHLVFVKNWMIPTLEHSGFVMPLAKSDIVVKKAVLAKLTSIDQRSLEQFDSLMDELASDDFRIREQATGMIEQNLDRWLDLIKQALLSDELSPEVYHRLNFIVSNSSKNDPVEELILAENLLNSPEYLIELFGLASPQESEAINNQLQRLTGKKFTKPEEWKKAELSKKMPSE